MPETPTLAPVCTLLVEVGESLDGGVTRSGRRRMTPILGGALHGIGEPGDPWAIVLPGGADRQLVRPDGAIEIDARYAARTPGGALIDIHASGLRRADPDGVYFRVAVRFECADPALSALQDHLYIADGVREHESVRHVVYRVD